MAEMFVTLGTWNWLIFGFILMAFELMAPGVFLFWLGLAALLVGMLSFAINPSWQAQLLMFAVFAAAAVPAWRYFAKSASSSLRLRRTPAMSARANSIRSVGGMAPLPGVNRARTNRSVTSEATPGLTSS